jgi:hypothetical protein
MVLGFIGLAWEWPLPLLAGTGLHRSIEARLIVYPLSALCALLIYQGTNSGLYYIIGMGAYFWAFSEGEVSKPLHENDNEEPTNTIPGRLPRTLDSTQARFHSPQIDCIVWSFHRKQQQYTSTSLLTKRTIPHYRPFHVQCPRRQRTPSHLSGRPPTLM